MKCKMVVTANEITAEWVERGREQKGHAEQQRVRRRERVRGIFVFLLVATIIVFALNYRAQIQDLAAAKLQQGMSHITSNKVRQSTAEYEKQLDDITR